MIVQPSPWPHIVTDSLISNEFINTICEASEHRIKNNKFGYMFLDESSRMYQDYYVTLEATRSNLLKLFDCKLDQNLQLVTHVTINPPGYVYPVHVDHPDKVISLITYIFPTTSVGTLLHETTTGPCVKLIEWKAGNTLIFASKNNVTWHSYHSAEDVRVTLCSIFVSNDLEFKKWKHDELNRYAK